MEHEPQANGTLAGAPPPAISTDTVRPTIWAMIGVWLRIGMQSFGGGAATLYLIRQESVQRQRWLTEEEFNRYWGVCQLSPGINLLGLTVLVGSHTGGPLGIVVSLVGLMLPSVLVTVALTAGYASIQGLEIVQNALRGIIPATIGLGLVLTYQMFMPIFKASKAEGPTGVGITLAIVACGLLAVGVLHVPLLAVLWVSGAVGALAAWWQARRKEQ